MPAKRSSRKPRTASPRPSGADATPPDPDAREVPPVVPVPQTPPPPKAGPPAGGARFAGRGNPRAAQSRRYAFRRS